MADPSIFLLEFPWGLFDAKVRQRLTVGEAVTFNAGHAGAIAIDECFELQSTERDFPLFPDGRVVQFGERRLRIYLLPSSRRRGIAQCGIKVLKAGRRIGEFTLTGVDAAGVPAEGKSVEDAAAERSLDLETLVQVLVENVVQLVDWGRGDVRRTGALMGLVRLSRDTAREICLAEPDLAEPRMSLIVRHAQDLHRHVVDLASHPRRILARKRDMQPVHRIQELDSACLGWYVRQPGRTALEKAGVKQELMGVIREETLDTPENRVLKDFLRRTVHAAGQYRIANQSLSASARWQSVSRYGAACASLLHQPELHAIRGLSGPPSQNYVLQFDPRYRRIWDAYLRLVRLEDEQDSAWAWQRRLWADHVRLMLEMALACWPGAKILAEPPLYLRLDQDHGSWVAPQDIDLVLLLQTATAEAVITAVDPSAVNSPAEVGTDLAPLFPDLVIRVDQVNSDRSGYLVIWATHGAGIEPFPLDVATESAARALRRWIDEREFLGEPAPPVLGVVLTPNPVLDAPLELHSAEGVTGLALPVHGRFATDALDVVARTVVQGVGDILK